MRGNDLDNSPVRRYYVTSEVAFRKVEEEEKPKKGRWLRTMFTHRVVWMPDLQSLSKLWRWSSSYGARLELVFIGDMARDATILWAMLEHGAANPFSDMQVFEDAEAISKMLPYRPDLMGVIDTSARSAMFGGRGMTMEMLP